MATVLGHPGIFTQHVARKDYHCDGPHDTYFRSALPPHSEIGNTGWWLHRLCWTCAPVELTTSVRPARVADPTTGETR